jgi:hypothetical protein
MINSHDRSYYIGASDTSYVIGNWETKTFEKWYFTKLGIYSMDFTNEAMLAGTYYEHRILDTLNIFNLEKDRQIIKNRLRVNLDGCTTDTIYEVKTHSNDKPFKITKAYRCQVNVEMYAFNIRKAYIVAYGLEDKDYDNFYRDIDEERLKMYPIEYDEDFINNEYLPKLHYLSECLDKGIFPQTNYKGEIQHGI